jgi:anti-sigma regulatory factor (Ser/Thr protein kinase)
VTEQTTFHVGDRRLDVSAFADDFSAWCERHAVPERVLLAFQTALDDVLTNIVDYAGEARQAPIEVRVRLHPDALEAEVIDDGVSFDPLDSARTPDLAAGVEERPIGGLGVHLVRRLMDDVRYRREHDRNHLTLTKRFGAPTGKTK